jgi:hypothetical protein
VKTTTALAVTMMVLMIIAYLGLVAAPSRAVAGELLGGTLGGVVGVGLGIVAISSIAPMLEAREARIATIIAGVTLEGGFGVTAGVLAAGRLLDVRGNVPGCFLGGLVGGLVSAFVVPFLSLFGIPEGTTEFLGMLLLPITSAIGVTVGFGRGVANLPRAE